jgi:5-methyltetrahydropteroyltriglutamate--homocysteine methyltransferase
VPLDVSLETHLPPTLLTRLAFAAQKLVELVSVARGGPSPPLDLATYSGAPAEGASKALAADLFRRPVAYAVRRPQQPQFPAFPTTTIGSFPQTPAIRRARLLHKKGQLSDAEYK